MAMPQTRDELNQAIAEQIWAAFPDKQIKDIGKLSKFFPGYDALTLEIVAIKQDLEGIVHYDHLPQVLN